MNICYERSFDYIMVDPDPKSFMMKENENNRKTGVEDGRQSSRVTHQFRVRPPAVVMRFED